MWHLHQDLGLHVARSLLVIITLIFVFYIFLPNYLSILYIVRYLKFPLILYIIYLSSLILSYFDQPPVRSKFYSILITFRGRVEFFVILFFECSRPLFLLRIARGSLRCVTDIGAVVIAYASDFLCARLIYWSVSLFEQSCWHVFSSLHILFWSRQSPVPHIKPKILIKIFVKLFKCRHEYKMEMFIKVHKNAIWYYL